MNAMGCPQRIEYAWKIKQLKCEKEVKYNRGNQEAQVSLTMPLTPQLKTNSTTPIEPFVICEAIVPKLTAGDRHAKYKKRMAGITFLLLLKASVQSET
jgi:hypothetical protein